MQAMDDMALLREYATRNSEAAFAEVVSRRIGFVYAAALRQVRDPHLAEEIAQAVFIILAQKAGRIPDPTILAGWFFKTTRFAALAHLRAVAKQSARTAILEKELQMQTEISSATSDEIWNQMSPLLDEALARLGEKDRRAVLLRFFENKSLAEVGAALGAGEDTARKRVSRALEKLHRYFSKRGVSSTTAIIGETISTHSVQIVPAMLAKSVTTVAIAKGSIAAASTLTLVKGTLKILTWTKLKFALETASAILLAGGAMTVALSQGDVSPSPVNSAPAPNVPSILMTARFLVVPDESLKIVKIPWQTKSGTTTALLAETQVRDAIHSITNANGAKMISGPRVVTISGEEATFSVTKAAALSGTNAQTGIFLKVTPSVAGNMIDLKLAAEFSEVPEGLPQLLTTRAETTVQLAKGQTLLLRKEIGNSGGQTADATPRSLLVFVTPSQVATKLQRLGPGNGQMVIRTYQGSNAVTRTNNYALPPQR